MTTGIPPEKARNGNRFLFLVTGCMALAMSVEAANLPWVYDTSSRVEAVPSVEESSASNLDSKASDVDLGASDWLSSVFFDQEDSLGCNLTSTLLGLRLIFR